MSRSFTYRGAESRVPGIVGGMNDINPIEAQDPRFLTCNQKQPADLATVDWMDLLPFLGGWET
jgi:hypothetical protein